MIEVIYVPASEVFDTVPWALPDNPNVRYELEGWYWRDERLMEGPFPTREQALEDAGGVEV